LIARAAAEGTEILRRPDANPCCVLGVIVKPAVQTQAVA
jgi:hypothetical protein